MPKLIKKGKIRKYYYGSSWKEVLLEIYHSPITTISPHNKSRVSNKEYILKTLNISEEDLSEATDFLVLQRLIEKHPESKNIDAPLHLIAILTEKGFNVALELERNVENNKTQATIIVLTTVLALTAFYELLYKVITNFNWISFSLVLILGIIIIILGIITYRKIIK